jgi:pimeloyl-ACP methyl ester carboxylesterase
MASAALQRFYLPLGDRQVHVAVAGRGAPLVLLHSPPLYSLSLRPLIDALAAHFTLVVPDLAGYGLSDPLALEKPTVADYARDLGQVLDALGLRGYGIYAAEDAAPIAVALAEHRRAQLTALVLDEPALLEEPEISAFEETLPVFIPEPSGGHLMRMWDTARMRYLFRPAHLPRLANRLDRDMASPAELDEVVKAYMRAGARYATAQCAGLRERWAVRLHALALPTLVLAHERAPATRLPEPGAHLSVQRLGHEPGPRAAAIVPFVGPRAAADSRGPEIPSGRPATRRGDFSRLFIAVPGGHLHARVSFEGSGRPVVAMHDPAGSHALVLSFTRRLVGSRPVIALDMPGNGESDNTIGTQDITPADYARAVLEAIDSLGLDEVDLIGRYSGGPVAMEMAFARPRLVKHIVQAAIDLYDPADVTDVLANYMPDMSPVRDGAHLVLAWYNMKNQALFWPWFRQTRSGIIWGEPQLDPQLIHQRVFDLLRVGNMYYQAYKAMWTYPMEERLPQLTVPTLLCVPRWDPIYAGLERAARIAPPCCRVETLPNAFADWADSFQRFFDGA